MAANGQFLEGGDKTIPLKLAFRHMVDSELIPGIKWEEATFYEAEIQVDAILSYPWLKKNKIGIFPHRLALCREEPKLTYLFGAELPGNKKKKKYKNGKKNSEKWKNVCRIKKIKNDAKWLEEGYTVRAEMMEKISQAIPEWEKWEWVDAFATPENSRFSEHWPDAFSQNWEDPVHSQKTLWLNPPFSKWEKVTELVQKASMRCVCCVPDWGQNYLAPLLYLADERFYIPSGAPFFEIEKRKLPPTRWGIWILIIPAKKREFVEGWDDKFELLYPKVNVLPLNKKNQSTPPPW
jgi:hypothetical protein